MKYKIAIKRNAQKSLSKIPHPFQQQIIESIKHLSDDPYPKNSKKLSGRPAWRIRIGDYRIIYEINNNILNILILVISHRKNVYKK